MEGSVSMEEIDELSSLPDNMLHHILSFLDAKSMVKTSILSRRWKCLWKDVPVLNFRVTCYPVFKECVDKILSLRSRHINVGKVTFDQLREVLRDDPDMQTFDRVMQYVASQGNGGHLHHLSIEIGPGGLAKFSYFAASIVASRHHQSLRTLELADFRLESLMSVGFKLLTNLQLFRCNLYDLDDPFADFPSLKSLKLISCHSKGLEVSGLQLVDLEIRWVEEAIEEKIEVFAPKLKSFLLEGANHHHRRYPKLNLPILEHANIRIRWWDQLQFPNDRSMEAANRASIELLLDLHNVESLVLCFDRYEHCIVEGIPIAAMNSLMESGPSPFTRLKTLKFQYRGRTPFVPYQVIRYFLDGSPDSKDKSFALEKICD
ncbi:Putative FBD-associated F-box protein At5g22720 [Linum grandiflorum]